MVNDFLPTMTDPAVETVYDLPAALFDEADLSLKWHEGRAEVWVDRPGKGLISRSTTARQLWRQLAYNPRSLGLVTPYLILIRGFRHRLTRLRQQGIAIDILTNSLASTDVPLIHGAFQRYLGCLLRRGIRVAEFYHGHSSLHIKLILLGEERALFGSLNLDPRSLFLNTELMLHLHCLADLRG